MEIIKDIFWTLVLCIGIIAAMAAVVMIFEFVFSII